MAVVTVWYKKDEAVHDLGQCMRLDDEYSQVEAYFKGKGLAVGKCT